MKTTKHYVVREFINQEELKPTSTGMIISQVHSEEGDNYKGTDNFIKITDCSRTINLDIDYWNNKEYANVLFKLDTLLDVLESTRRHIVIQKKQLGDMKSEE